MAERQHARPQVEAPGVVHRDKAELRERVQAAARGGTRNPRAMAHLRNRHPPPLVGQREQNGEPASERGDEIGVVIESRDRVRGDRVGGGERERGGGQRPLLGVVDLDLAQCRAAFHHEDLAIHVRARAPGEPPEPFPAERAEAYRKLGRNADFLGAVRPLSRYTPLTPFGAEPYRYGKSAPGACDCARGEPHATRKRDGRSGDQEGHYRRTAAGAR